jgi:hypothetical protein
LRGKTISKKKRKKKILKKNMSQNKRDTSLSLFFSRPLSGRQLTRRPFPGKQNNQFLRLLKKTNKQKQTKKQSRHS